VKVKDRFEDILSKKSWLIKESSWERGEQGVRETQFTLGNGYICSRGVLEEIPYDAQPGTYIAGLYDEAGSQVTEIVNLPNPVNFRLIAQGEKIDAVAMDVISHHRILDMQKALLKRKTVYSTANNERFDYQSLRFFSKDTPHIGAMRVHFTPLDADTEIIAETFVDTSMTNKGILSEGRKRHFEVTKFINKKFVNYVCVKTFQHKIGVGYAGYLEVEHNGKKRATGDKIMKFLVKKGDTITFTKIFAVHSSRDLRFKGGLQKTAFRSLGKAVKIGFNGLLRRHAAAWKQIWDTADIDVRPDANLQKALRFNMYHMLICASSDDDRSSIPARTLSGEGYRGHIFWDTEIFVLPFFIYNFPQIARNLLYYRYRTLPAARRNARERGYKGALFSWESAETGKETTPPWHRDLDGRIIKIYTGKMEYHIVADIAYAVSHYYAVSGDEEFMLKAGCEILFETARFWASKAESNKSGDTYSIKNVIGPDEFHIKVNDNAFTNVAARWNLVEATRLYRKYEARGAASFKKMIKRIRLREGEVRNWARISNRIHIKTNRSGIIEAFNDYFKRKYIRIKELDDNLMPALPKNIPLKRIKRTQFIKQADTLMIFHLFPKNYPLSQRKKNFIYYDRRTLHKSSLSHSMHALTGWEAGIYGKSYHYFIFSLYGDLENKHGNTPEGIHAASLGGNWQVVYHAFAGIRLSGTGSDGSGGKDILTIAPSLPSGVSSLRLKTRYRGWLLSIQVGKRYIKITPEVKNGNMLEISVYGRGVTLKDKKSYVFNRRG